MKDIIGIAEVPEDDALGTIGFAMVDTNAPCQQGDPCIPFDGYDLLRREGVVAQYANGEGKFIGGGREFGEWPSGIGPADAGTAGGGEGLGWGFGVEIMLHMGEG